MPVSDVQAKILCAYIDNFLDIQNSSCVALYNLISLLVCSIKYADASMLSGSTYMNELMLSIIDERSEVNMLWLFLCLDDTVGKKLFSMTSPKIREFNESFIAELVAGEDELTKRTLTIIKNYMSYEWIFEMALNSVRRLKANIEAKTASPSKLSDDMQNAMMQSRSSNMKCNLLTEFHSKKIQNPQEKKNTLKRSSQKGTDYRGATTPETGEQVKERQRQYYQANKDLYIRYLLPPLTEEIHADFETEIVSAMVGCL